MDWLDKLQAAAEAWLDADDAETNGHEQSIDRLTQALYLARARFDDLMTPERILTLIACARAAKQAEYKLSCADATRYSDDPVAWDEAAEAGQILSQALDAVHE